jgi:hypothetical protein
VHFKKFAFSLAVFVATLFLVETGNAQNLGYRLPGLIGLDAGRIPGPGVYLIDRAVLYDADQIRDRNGRVIPVKLEMEAFANAFGASYTRKLSGKGLFLSMTAAVPVARLRLNIHDRPEASFDRFGLTDIFIQPARLGWRTDYFDVVGAYGIYLPTGDFPFAGGKGLSSGQITHQFSAGGSIYANKDQTAFFTALASYDLNLRKHDIDITRGDILQVQGGLGVSRNKHSVELGLASYGLWQVRPDRGADVPPAVLGQRDHVIGLGPETALTIKAIRAQLRVRYVWDLSVRARPKGNILVAGIVFGFRQPKQPPGTTP